MAIDKESLKKVWNKYFKGQFSYKVLKEQFVPDEESKKEIDDLLEEIDSTPKEQLVDLEVKSNRNSWKKHRFKVLAGIIIFHILTFKKTLSVVDTETTVLIMVSSVSLLYWVFTGNSTKPPDNPT